MANQFLGVPVRILDMCLNQQSSQSPSLSLTPFGLPQGQRPLLLSARILSRWTPVTFARQVEHLTYSLSSPSSGRRQYKHKPSALSLLRYFLWYSSCWGLLLAILFSIRNSIAAQVRPVNSPTGGKPCRASPSVSPALKGGVLGGGTAIKERGGARYPGGHLKRRANPKNRLPR